METGNQKLNSFIQESKSKGNGEEIPVESFLMRVELWADRNIIAPASFFLREDSIKTSNTNSTARHSSSSSTAAAAATTSRRFLSTTNLKATTTRVRNPDGRVHRRPLPKLVMTPITNQKLQPPVEPGSPKVSCFGRILPPDCQCNVSSTPLKSAGGKERVEEEEEEEETAVGCWTMFGSLFSFHDRHKTSPENSIEENSSVQSWEETRTRKTTASSAAAVGVGVDRHRVVPGLGGMKRLASGRKAGSWSDDIDWAITGELQWPAINRRRDGSSSV